MVSCVCYPTSELKKSRKRKLRTSLIASLIVLQSKLPSSLDRFRHTNKRKDYASQKYFVKVIKIIDTMLR